MHNSIVVEVFKRYYELRSKESNLVFGESVLAVQVEQITARTVLHNEHDRIALALPAFQNSTVWKANSKFVTNGWEICRRMSYSERVWLKRRRFKITSFRMTFIA